jgi:type IV pilus assembly protein PilM
VVANFTDPDGAPTIRVLVGAAHRDLIDGVVKAVIEAGLVPVGIDLDTAALARALKDPAFAGRPEAVVSVGAGLTMVVVHQDGQLQFVRTIDLGGATITAAIASALDLPIADCEQVKRQLTGPGPHDARAVTATAEAVTELVDEIHSSIRFFSGLPGRSTPQRIVITGAGAQVAGFMEALQRGIDFPVEEASTLSLIDASHLSLDEEQADAINRTLAVPVGLALPDPSGEQFNLLPHEVVEERQRRRITRALAVCGILLLLLVIAGTAYRVLSVHSANATLTSLQDQLTYINKVQIPKYDKVVALSQQVQELQTKYEPLVATEVDWLVVLNQFSQYLPPTAVVSDMQLNVSSAPTLSTQSSKTTATAASSSSASSATAKSRSSKKKSTKVVPKATPNTAQIGSGSASVSVPNLTALPTFGTSMSQSPALTLGPLSGSLNTATLVTFSISFGINKQAGSHRLQLYTEAIP